MSKLILLKAKSMFKTAPRKVSMPTADEETGAERTGELQTFPSSDTAELLVTEQQVNSALEGITAGVVGFDTEFTERKPTKEEQVVLDYFPHAPGNRKGAILGLQIAQLHAKTKFEVAWENVGIRLVQIAWEKDVWVIDLRAIKGIPKELARILRSPDVIKAGVGLIKDIAVVWDDMRMEMMHLVDVGMMSRLLLAENYPKAAYGNMSLKNSVEDGLGYSISKDLTQSDWAAAKLTDEQIEYAALDAVASLRLYEVLGPALERRSTEIDSQIPGAWYTFNTKAGEPTRVKRAADGTEITWKTSDCRNPTPIEGESFGNPDGKADESKRQSSYIR
ncbi:ribonuclease H-like domain-containing protein [Mycena filopes]|nr:ribonuclease H-like domain-containing protein [Mycena filopes]